MSDFMSLSRNYGDDWDGMWEQFLLLLTTVTDAVEAMGAISTSTHAVTTGTKTFALIPATRVFPAGEAIRAVSVDNGAVVLRGTVDPASVAGSVVVNVTEVAGTGGPYGRWQLLLAGPKGDRGDDGDDGAPGLGTVTTVSVAAANGFSGTVANAGTTPAISVRTSVTGLLKGNGTAVSAAVAGTDYVAPGGAGAFTTLTSSGNTTLGDAAADSLTINAGIVNAPNMPAFHAYMSGSTGSLSGTVTVAGWSEVFDIGSNFVPATGIFTAPAGAGGKYLFSVGLYATGLASSRYVAMLVTSNRNYVLYDGNPSAGSVSGSCELCATSIIADMDAGDTAFVRVVGSPSTLTIYGAASADEYSYFSGVKLC